MALKHERPHLVVVPVNYPDEANPMKGIFYRRQALALSETGLDVTVIAVQIVTLLQLFKNPFRLLKMARSDESEGGFREIRCTAIQWRPGSEAAIVAAHSRALIRELKRFSRIDLLQAHVGWFAGASTARAARALKLPYIITEHSSLILSPEGVSAYRRDALADAYHGAHANIAVSRFLKTAMETHFSAPRVEVIPNGVDGYFFHPAVRQKTENTIFSAGNLKASKGFRELITAFAEIDSRYHLSIAGSGSIDFTEELHQLVADLKLTDRVTFTGRLNAEALRDEMQRACCFALPSYHETFGVVYIEALACGLPVLAGKKGGHTEFITSERGVLVDAHDHVDVVRGLNELVGSLASFDPAVLRNGILEEFGHDIVAARMRNLIDRVLEGELLDGEHRR